MSDRSDKVFVLVHGSFHGAWAFEKLTPPLAAEGHPVIARDLPGHGLRARFPRSYLEDPLDPEKLAAEPSPIAHLRLRDFADPVIATIEQIAERSPGRRIVLVGHSFAGLILSLVGEAIPHLVGRLVYLSAFMNATGKSANDYLGTPEFATSLLPPLLVADPAVTGAMRINPRSTDPAYTAQLKATLAADIGDEDWEAVAGLLTPDIPAAPHAEPVTLTADGWGSIPRTYICCTADKGFPPAAQHRFIHEADAFTPSNPTDVHELPTSHSPIYSQPERLAHILLRL